MELCSERKPILTADKIKEPSLPEVRPCSLLLLARQAVATQCRSDRPFVNGQACGSGQACVDAAKGLQCSRDACLAATEQRLLLISVATCQCAAAWPPCCCRF